MIVETASDKKATDIALLDARGICNFTDYFVILNGESRKQIEAIRDEIGRVLKKAGIRPHHTEGTADSGWLLIDLSDIIIHIFTPEERQHYQLERLWAEAVPVVRVQ